jgi:hypothetical protein
MRTNAWKWALVLASVLGACGGNTTPTTDAGGSDAFIALHDSGGADAGPPSDANVVDANVPPYDGGPAVSCTGLTALTLSTYCAAYADAYVAQDTRCGLLGSAGATELRAALIAGCNTHNLQSRVTAGTVTFDGAMAACCFAHSAGDTDCYLPVGAGDTSCDYIHGTIANGQPCVNSAECTDGYCHVDGSCPGTCTAFAAPGSHCNVGDVVCDNMSNCDTGYNGATNLCIRETGTAGMACNPTGGMGCALGFNCNIPSGATAGTCVAHPVRGQTCDANDILCDLNSSICNYDFTSMAGVCTPPLAIGTMRCLIDAQCLGDAYCRGPDYQHMVYGTCTARAARGASCATDHCVTGLVCLPNMTCGDAPALGASCNGISGCNGGICNGSGTCVALHATNAPCTANTDCASGNCRANTLTCAPDCNP